MSDINTQHPDYLLGYKEGKEDGQDSVRYCVGAVPPKGKSLEYLQGWDKGYLEEVL